MKNITKAICGLALTLAFVACGGDSGQGKNSALTNLKVGATPVPAAEILEFIKPQLAKEGINLQVQNFTDYVMPNTSLAEGSSDANLYQHKPFMDRTNKEKGYNLVAIAPIYVVPLGFYSQRIKNVDELPQGATIAIPGDASNMARAFILLHDNKLIRLKDPTNLSATELDITENPKKIIFKPMEAASLPLVLDSVDGAVINANYALQAKMSLSTSLFHENDKSAYVNVLVTREENKNDERIAKLKDALLSQETRDFILSKYNGEIIPVSKGN